jgi:hypothetical protein
MVALNLEDGSVMLLKARESVEIIGDHNYIGTSDSEGAGGWTARSKRVVIRTA